MHVLGAILVHGAEGAAAVVRLRNDSAHALRDVPIAITVKNVRGSTVFQNNAPGLEAALTSLGSLPAHGEATWVDDQVPATGVPASVTAIAGVSPAASGALPQIEVSGVHPSEESGSATTAGTVRNRSNVIQQALVVYVLARRAGRVVAAGRRSCRKWCRAPQLRFRRSSWVQPRERRCKPAHRRRRLAPENVSHTHRRKKRTRQRCDEVAFFSARVLRPGEIGRPLRSPTIGLGRSGWGSDGTLADGPGIDFLNILISLPSSYQGNNPCKYLDDQQ